MRNKIKPWTKDEENLLIKLRESGYTYKQISIEIGRSAGSCRMKYNRLTDPNYIEKYKQYYKQYYKDNREKKLEYQKQYCEDNREKIAEYNKQYQKQYYKDNREKKLEYQKQYREDNRDRCLEYQKQYYQDNRDRCLEYKKQYYQDNRDEKLEYQKQYNKNNKDQIAEYRRNYYAQNPHKTTRKERYDGEFADMQLCHDFYNHICPITGMKNDLQVHHLISIRDNQDFWESATDEEKINNLILISKDLHMAYHIWLGGTKVTSTPESFWEFIDTVYFNEK